MTVRACQTAHVQLDYVFLFLFYIILFYLLRALVVAVVVIAAVVDAVLCCLQRPCLHATARPGEAVAAEEERFLTAEFVISYDNAFLSLRLARSRVFRERAA